MIDEILHDRREEILETATDSDSSEEAPTVSKYVGQKLAKRSKCADCKIKRKVPDENLKHDTYLSQFSRGVSFVPSKKLAFYTLYSCFCHFRLC